MLTICNVVAVLLSKNFIKQVIDWIPKIPNEAITMTIPRSFRQHSFKDHILSLEVIGLQKEWVETSVHFLVLLTGIHEQMRNAFCLPLTTLTHLYLVPSRLVLEMNRFY